MASRSDWCKHYHGLSNGPVCKAGIAYESVQKPNTPPAQGKSVPCIPDCNKEGAVCPKFELPSEEEWVERQARIARKYECLQRGVSDCCEAPIDESHVIQSGRHKGHGSRFCSKCGKLLFMV